MNNFNEFMDLPVIDCHVHIGFDRNASLKPIDNIDASLKGYVHVMENCRLRAINALSLAASGDQQISSNILTLLMKCLYPERVYAFASLHYPAEGALNGGYDFLEQTKRFAGMGFDGMKMIEGKPNVRKKTGLRLDSELYDEYYKFLETEGIPLLYHVADPEIYWDPARVPEYAVKFGWSYLDGTFPEKEALHRETEGILAKFPGLKVIFAHFYFMSRDIKRASEILDKWPNISFDITPGSHNYEDFAESPEAWRDFFVKYQDRILFGTDQSQNQAVAEDLIYDVRTFLETGREFVFKSLGCKTKGLNLERDVLEKIYTKNFLKYVGNSPKKLKPDLVLVECRRIIKEAADRSLDRGIIDVLEAITDKMEAASKR